MHRYGPLATAFLALALASSAAAVELEASGFREIGRSGAVPNQRLALDGRTAYRMGSGSLEAIDLSDPSQPRLQAALDLPGGVGDLAARDGWVYATTGAGFTVIDARRPGRLRVAATVANDDGYGFSRFALSGDLVYAISYANDVQTLAIIDVGEPSRPAVMRQLPMSLPRDVAVDGDRLYVLAFYGLIMLDATDPRSPVEMATITLDGALSEGQSVHAHAGRVHCTIRSHDYVLTIDKTGAVTSLFGYADGGVTRALAFQGDAVYGANGFLGRRLQPHQQFPDWVDQDLQVATDVAIDGDLLVATFTYDGLATYALDGDRAPQRLALLAAGAPVLDIAVAGDRAYLACGPAGLRILDVSDPGDPRPLGGYAPPVDAWYEERSCGDAVSLCRDRALLLGYGGLLVIDIADASAPRPVLFAPRLPDGRRYHPWSALAVADGWLVDCEVWDDARYGSTRAVMGLQLAPGDDLVLREVAWPADVPRRNWTAAGPHFVAADDLNGLCVFDAAADGTIRRLGAAPLGGASSAWLAAAGELACVGGGHRLTIVEIGDPAQPRVRASLDLSKWWMTGSLTGLAAVDGSVLAMFERGYVGLVDISRPDQPAAWQPVELAGGASALTGADELLFAGTMHGGVAVLQPAGVDFAAASAPPAAATGGLAAAPNPCNPRTTITLRLESGGPARVDVFDARGRRVRRLHDGPLGSGSHALAWDGADAAGRPVAAGVYRVRASTPGAVRTVGVTIVK